jgi:hypothetical protein
MLVKWQTSGNVRGGTQQPQYILSAELMAHWDLVKDDQILHFRCSSFLPSN